MYLEHFGLDRPPFKITPDTSLFFEGSKRGAALGALIYAISNGEGIIKVVGEVGSGKTMLCRMLEVRLTDQVDIIYIANPSLSPDNILHVIAHELGLDTNDDSSKVDVMQQIQQHLLAKHAEDRQVVMFVEEAQSMPLETLEEIRLLSNLETDQNKLLQMILFGQPELDEKLSQPHIRQLKERITHSFNLEPFRRGDTHEYLNFRMRSVGYRGPDIFEQAVANRIERYSSGLTRRINILADKALLAAFSEGSHKVDGKHVKIAARDSDFEPIATRPWLKPVALVASLLLAAWLGSMLPGILERPERPVAVVETEKGNDDITTIETRQQETAIADAQVIESEPEAMQTDTPKEPADTGAYNRLERRVAETKVWMQEVEQSGYSIQLMLARIDAGGALLEFLSDLPESLDLNEIYIYETEINGSPMYSVIYSDYGSYGDALTSLSVLSNDLPSKPFIRRVSAIYSEYATHNRSPMESAASTNYAVNP